MNILKIDSTEIILQNYEKGQGKIIISDLYHGSYSFYWGSMGDSTIEIFLKRINSDYFAGKLCNEKNIFSGKNTARNIRKWIREEMSIDLPWYRFMSAQKELREKIKELDYCDNQYQAMYLIENLHDSLDCFDLDYIEEKEFRKIIEDNFTQEVWNLFGTETSSEYKFLKKLHKKLVKML